MRLILEGREFRLTSDSRTKTNTSYSAKCQFQMYLISITVVNATLSSCNIWVMLILSNFFTVYLTFTSSWHLIE